MIERDAVDLGIGFQRPAWFRRHREALERNQTLDPDAVEILARASDRETFESRHVDSDSSQEAERL